MSVEAEAKPVPYTLRLKDGRTLYFNLPADQVSHDYDGRMLLRPGAIRLIERARALATPLTRQSSPGHLITVRDAFGLSVASFAERIGVGEDTVAQWEKGKASPSAETLETLRKLVKAATERGVILAA